MNSEFASPKPEEENGKGVSKELLAKSQELTNTPNIAELIHCFSADSREYAIVYQTFGKTFRVQANPAMNIAVVEITNPKKPKDSDETFYNPGQHKVQVQEWRPSLNVLLRAKGLEQDGRVIACLNKVTVKLQPRQLAELTNVLEDSIKRMLSIQKGADLSRIHDNLKAAVPALGKGAMSSVRGALGG